MYKITSIIYRLINQTTGTYICATHDDLRNNFFAKRQTTTAVFTFSPQPKLLIDFENIDLYI